MSLKNYYAVLGVPQAATSDDIKTAFRNLAKKYHPDKAPENPFATAHFTEIQEAYDVLAHPGRRAAYDEERWLRGLTNRTQAAIRITPDWILAEAGRLNRHMMSVDTYRMNHTALRDYIGALLSPEHLSVLQETPQYRGAILEEIISSTQKLRNNYIGDVAQHLQLLAGDDASLLLRIKKWESARRIEARWDAYRPVLVIFFAVLICVLIWWMK